MLIIAVRVRVNGALYKQFWLLSFFPLTAEVRTGRDFRLCRATKGTDTLSHCLSSRPFIFKEQNRKLFLKKEVFKHLCIYKSECHCILVSIPCARSSRAVLISKTFLSRESRSLVWADSWLVTVSCSLLCWTQVAHMGQLLPELRRSCSTLNRRSSTLASRVVGLDGGTGHFIKPLTDMEWRMC